MPSRKTYILCAASLTHGPVQERRRSALPSGGQKLAAAKHHACAGILGILTIALLGLANAAELDAGRITKDQFDTGELMAAYHFGTETLAIDKWLDEQRAKWVEERRVQAQDRAAAAAEQANKIEAQKLCIQLTGHLCPVPRPVTGDDTRCVARFHGTIAHDCIAIVAQSSLAGAGLDVKTPSKLLHDDFSAIVQGWSGFGHGSSLQASRLMQSLQSSASDRAIIGDFQVVRRQCQNVKVMQVMKTPVHRSIVASRVNDPSLGATEERQ